MHGQLACRFCFLNFQAQLAMLQKEFGADLEKEKTQA